MRGRCVEARAGALRMLIEARQRVIHRANAARSAPISAHDRVRHPHNRVLEPSQYGQRPEHVHDEKPQINGNKCSLVVGKVEVWGLPGRRDYERRKAAKKAFYQRHARCLLEWTVTEPIPNLARTPVAPAAT